jgi:uncharacterized protein (DUF427 family)
MARAIWNGIVVAESDDTIVVNGYTYFPRDDVRWEYLETSEHTSHCSWKGDARYYTLHVNGSTNANAAWHYPDAKPEAAHVQGRIGFWRGVEVGS